MEEPLSSVEARRLVRLALNAGRTFFSKHARQRMSEWDMRETDVVNVLRGGWINDPAELENGTWRYKVETYGFVVVVAFRNVDDELRIEVVAVTTWRKS